MTWQRKYDWRLTWPGEDRKDWIAVHDRLTIGRIHLDVTSPKAGTYLWAGNCSCWWGFERPLPDRGWEATAAEAAKRVEDWYDAGCLATGPRPPLVAKVIRDLEERMANWPQKRQSG